MSLSNTQLIVALVDQDDQSTEHQVEVRYPDMLRAELEGPRHGLSDLKAAPMHYMALWAWAAMVRTGAYDGNFPSFKSRILMIEAEEEVTVEDPTQPGQSSGSA